jgi:hypothetical protein
MRYLKRHSSRSPLPIDAAVARGAAGPLGWI